MTDEITFYTNPMSRGRTARWMLEEAGVPYRSRYLNFGPEMKTADYKALNPMGKVPTIVHGGTVVTEVAAICAYLADAFPEQGLAPPTDRRGAYYRWLFFAAGPLEAAVTNRAMDFKVPPEKQGFIGYGDFASVMEALEAAVSQRTYVAGDTFTAADVYVGGHVGWGMRQGSIEKRPAFLSYHGRLKNRPAFLKAMAADDAAMAEASQAG